MANVILKFNDPIEIQYSKEGIRLVKISGAIPALNFIELIKYADLKVNPRKANVNKITRSIIETLKQNPGLFFFKTKGLLIASKKYIQKEIDEVEISMDDPSMEGIMDGGHNSLAIASYLLDLLLNIKKIKTWDECKNYIIENHDALISKASELSDDKNFSIPIEVISILDEEDSITDYNKYLTEICSARNNNVEINEAASGNHAGYYDFIKEVMGDDFDIAWKKGEDGIINSDDVLNLICIPLLYLHEKKMLPDVIKPINKICIYSQKAKCVEFVNSILKHQAVGSTINGKYYLNNDLVKSAIIITKDIMYFFDRLYLKFPKLYNKYGNFGNISAVKNKKSNLPYISIDAQSDYTYPLGFLYPLLWGLKKLMSISDNGMLTWKINPLDIILDDIDVKAYYEIIKIVSFDPQKVGKKEAPYSNGEMIFNSLL